MSVDTYLKGKNASSYSQRTEGKVKLLLSPKLTAWAEEVHISTTNWLVTRRLRVEVEHRHTAACRH